MTANKSFLYRDFADRLQKKYAESFEKTARIIYNGDLRSAKEYSAEIKTLMRKKIPFPFPKESLKPSLTGTIEFVDYTLSKYVFETLPNHHIPVHLYQPKPLKTRRPALVIPIGHHLEGKSLPEHQIMCANFAAQGFVVICTDPMGQGERDFYPGIERNAKQLEYAAVDEHMRVAHLLMMLDGEINITSMFLWDSVRLVDFLETLPHVDKTRIGVTGQSGGGAQTMMLGVIDDRFCAVSPIQSAGVGMYGVCYGVGDAEQSVYKLSGEIGVDFVDKAFGVFPKKLMLSCDRIDADQCGLKFIDQHLTRLYGLAGIPQNYEMNVADCGHVIERQVREFAYNWFGKHLKGNAEAACEKETEVLSPERLRCYPDNFKTITSYGYCGVLLEKARSESDADGRPLKEKIKGALGGYEDAHTIEIFSRDADGATDFVLHTSSNQYAVCSLSKGEGGTLCVVIDSVKYYSGRDFGGAPVLNVIPCGILRGDLKDEYDFDPLTSSAIAASVLGENIFRKRLVQTLTAIKYAQDETGCGMVSFYGSGQGGLLSLCAALYARTLEINTYRTVSAFEGYFKNIDYVIDESSVIPGLIGICDVAGVAAATGARVSFTDPLDERKMIMDGETARNLFGSNIKYIFTR